jgi:hypothetical protein
MRTVTKRILLSIAGGTLFQLGIYLLFAIFNAAGLSVIFLFPGWLFGFAGIDSPQGWKNYIASWMVMVAVNNLLYSTLIYFVLWNRALTKESLKRRSW